MKLHTARTSSSLPKFFYLLIFLRAAESSRRRRRGQILRVFDVGRSAFDVNGGFMGINSLHAL